MHTQTHDDDGVSHWHNKWVGKCRLVVGVGPHMRMKTNVRGTWLPAHTVGKRVQWCWSLLPVLCSCPGLWPPCLPQMSLGHSNVPFSLSFGLWQPSPRKGCWYHSSSGSFSRSLCSTWKVIPGHSIHISADHTESFLECCCLSYRQHDQSTGADCG